MGLATIDPHTQKEHAEIPKSLSLVLIRLVLTEIHAFKNEKKITKKCMEMRTNQKSRFVRISIHFFVIFFRRVRLVDYLLKENSNW